MPVRVVLLLVCTLLVGCGADADTSNPTSGNQSFSSPKLSTKRSTPLEDRATSGIHESEKPTVTPPDIRKAIPIETKGKAENTQPSIKQFHPNTNAIAQAGEVIAHTRRIIDAVQENRTEDARVLMKQGGRRISPSVIQQSDMDVDLLWEKLVSPPLRFARFESPITDLALSPNGQVLVVAAGKGELRLFDPQSTAELAQLTGHSDWINTATFSADSRILVSYGRDQKTIIWDVATRKQLQVLEHKSTVLDAAISPKNKWIVTVEERAEHSDVSGDVTVWDVETGKKIRVLEGHKYIPRSVSLSPDGKTLVSLATASIRGSRLGPSELISWNVDDWSMVNSTGNIKGRLWFVRHNPAGNMIAVLGSGLRGRTGNTSINGVGLLDAEASAVRLVLETREAIPNRLSFSSDGSRLAVCSSFPNRSSAVWLADVAAGTFQAVFRGFDEGVGGVTFSDSNQTLLTGDFVGHIKEWNLVGRPPKSWYQGNLRTALHDHAIRTIRFSADGNTLAVAGDGAFVQLWDMQTLHGAATIWKYDFPILDVALSPHGKLLATAGGLTQGVKEKGQLIIWKTDTGERLHELEVKGGRVHCVLFSPDGKWLASGHQDRTIRIWDPDSGQLTASGSVHLGSAKSIAYSPDGQFLATGVIDKIQLWRIPNSLASKGGGTEPIKLIPMRTLRGHKHYILSLSFTPDGRHLVSSSYDGSTLVWSATSSDSQRSFPGSMHSLSPDGKLIATGMIRLGQADRTVSIWELETGHPIATIEHADNQNVSSLSFSPDGHFLATGGAGQLVKLWDPQTGEERWWIPRTKLGAK